MRAKTSGLGKVVPLAATGLLLAGCGATQTSGVVAIGPDTYAVETRGRALGTAVERGLTEASAFCTVQGRQTELQGTRINPDSYQVVFRCAGAAPGGVRGFTPPATAIAGGRPGPVMGATMGGAPVGGFSTRPSSLGPVPVSPPPMPVSRAPGGGVVLSGQAFPPPAQAPAGVADGTVPFIQPQPARVAGNPFGASSGAAAAPARDTLPSPAALAAMLTPAPAPSPLSASPVAQPLQPGAPIAPVAGGAPPMAMPATGASAPPVAPPPFQPLQSPLAPAASPGFAPPGSPTPASVPASVPGLSPLPAAAPPPFQPLQSPLAPAAAAAPGFAPPPAAPAPAFQPLPAARAPLQTISGGSAGPAPVSGPATIPAVAAPAMGGNSTTVVPPPAFWNAPAR